MSNRSTPFPLLLAFLVVFGTMLSCGKSGGSQFDDECEDYADAILGCLELDFDPSDAEKLTKDRCVDDLEESQDLDGNDCVEAQLAVYECIAPDGVRAGKELTDEQITECRDLFSFMALKWSDVFRLSPPALRGQPTDPLPFCDTEIRTAVDLCPQSIVLPGDPNNPL